MIIIFFEVVYHVQMRVNTQLLLELIKRKPGKLMPGYCLFELRLSTCWSGVTGNEFFSYCFECVRWNTNIILKVVIGLSANVAPGQFMVLATQLSNSVSGRTALSPANLVKT